MSHPLRVIFAGGGTGGHVYPALAMGAALRDRGEADAILYVGAEGGLDRSILDAAEVEYRLIPGTGMRGASVTGILRGTIDLVRGVVRGLAIIRRFTPDVVVGTGGYASASLVIAAFLTRTPRILQEQNRVPGLVNRRLARLASVVLLSYPDSIRWMPKARCVVVGNPLRKMHRATRAEGAEQFGLDPERPVVLVVGGSRGARKLCLAAAAAAGTLCGGDVQMLILAGTSNVREARERTADSQGVVVLDYLDDMGSAYAVADVAVARSGASSVFELAAHGIPTVFVPYPHAADDHQRLNVEPLEALQGCVVVRDADLTADRFALEVAALLDDAQLRSEMAGVMTNWTVGDSAAGAAEQIVECVKKKDPARGREWKRVEGVT